MHKRLKLLRKKLGLKQREFAERLDVKVSVVGAWEIKRQAIPKVRIYQICQEFNVNREWFETGEGSMFNPVPATSKSDTDVAREYLVSALRALPQEYQQYFKSVCEQFLEEQK